MKRTLIVLLAALALLAAILFKKRSAETSMRADAPVLDSASKAQVASFRVVKRPDTSALRKQDGRWVVAKDSFAVDTSKINKVMTELFSLQGKELVSKNPARLGEYGLDSGEAKHVTLSDASGKAMAQVVIGKTSGADYSSTYWKWEDKPEVYRTPGNFTWEIATKDNDWKDRKLFKEDPKEVRSVETTWKDSTGMTYSYKLEAVTDSTWKMVAPQDSNRVKNAAANEMASRFAEMSIDEFVAPGDSNLAKVSLDTPAVYVKISMKNGASHELKASPTLAGYAYTKHPTRSDLIKLSAWRFDTFKKKPFELLEAPPVAKADSSKSVAASAKPATAAASAPPAQAKAGKP